MTDWLLVQPPDSPYYSRRHTRLAPDLSPPLSLAYLAGALEAADLRAELLDLRLYEEPFAAFSAELSRRAPRAIGITAMTPNFPAAAALARLAREAMPEVPLVVGGYHPSALPEEAVATSCFDAAVIGEGEETIVELTHAFRRHSAELAAVAGIAYRAPSGEIVRTAPRPARDLVRLDRALEPKRNGFDAAAYPVHAIVTSRGCPRRCIFCTLGYQQGRERVRPIGTVLAEVSALREHFGVNEFFVHDDNFSADRRRAKALCAALSAAGLDVRWGCEVVARDVDEELAEALVAAGCSHVMLGVESGNAEVLRATKKGIRLDHAENAVRTFAAVGMPSITCSFIVGHPQDTPETVRETFDFALRLKSLGATKIRVGAMTPFPGTALYHSPEEHGIRILTKDWVEYVPTKIVMETRHLEKGEIGSLLVEGLLQFADELQRCNS